MTFDDSTSTPEDPYGIARTYERIQGEQQRGPDYEDCLEEPDDSAPENMKTALAMIAAMFGDGTVSELDAEPVLYSIVNAIDRQRTEVHHNHGAACSTLKEHAGQDDFSEIGAVRLEQAQTRAHQLEQREGHLEDVLRIAKNGYAEAIGKAWMHPKKSAPMLESPNAATVSAKQYLKAQRKKKLAATAPDGDLFAIMGPRNVPNIKAVTDALDALLQEHPDMILLHGADKGSEIDNAAVKWARENDVSHVFTDQPDYIRYKGAAPHKRNDDMIEMGPRAVIVFEIDGKRDHGISQNLAQKASRAKKKIPVRRVRI